MEKKDKPKKINPIRHFKRFLKEYGMLAFYQRNVKPKNGYKEFFKTIKPNEYLEPNDDNLTTSLTRDEQRFVKQELIKYKQEWMTFHILSPNLDYIKSKFVIFLKKRNAYKLYLSCFDRLYVLRQIQCRNNLGAWNRNGMNDKIIITKNDVKSWEDLNPKYYLTSAFDTYYTIKTPNFWEQLNDKWQEELKKIYAYE